MGEQEIFFAKAQEISVDLESVAHEVVSQLEQFKTFAEIKSALKNTSKNGVESGAGSPEIAGPFAYEQYKRPCESQFT